MRDLNLTRLRYFRAISAAGNMHRAAQQLHIAQPALSRHIRALEDELGVKLLTRNPRGVAPTEAGELLLQGAGVLLQMASQLGADIRARATVPRGEVRIGSLPSFTGLVLPYAIAALRMAYSEITFSLSQAYTPQLCDLLLAERLDLAVLTDIGNHPDLVAEALCEEQIWAVGLPGSLPARGLTLAPAQLASLPLVASRFLRAQLEETLGPDQTIHVVVELESSIPMEGLLKSGVGIYFGPPSLFWNELRSGTLQGKPVRGMASRRVLARKRNRAQTAAMLAVADELQASTARICAQSGSPLRPIG